MKTVLLLSGGLDSAVNLAIECEREQPEIFVLTIDYGQRAAKKEIAAAKALCAYYQERGRKIEHRILEQKWLGKLGGNALTDTMQELPQPSPGKEGDSELDSDKWTRASARQVWVPNRNGLMINIAAAFAESLGAEKVLVGFNAEEAMSFPDNTKVFMEEASHALHHSTKNHVRVSSYTLSWNKEQMVRAMKKLKTPFPFRLLWSCYTGAEQACGKCESCRRTLRALSVPMAEPKEEAGESNASNLH